MLLELPTGGIISAALGRRKLATRLDCLGEHSLNSQDCGSAERFLSLGEREQIPFRALGLEAVPDGPGAGYERR